jgi:hypothetical protein
MEFLWNFMSYDFLGEGMMPSPNPTSIVVDVVFNAVVFKSERRGEIESAGAT